jgi:hypothetical protein
VTTHREEFTRRMALSRVIRSTLADTLPTPEARARWLRREAEYILREAERAKRPLEVFPADPIAEAF